MAVGETAQAPGKVVAGPDRFAFLHAGKILFVSDLEFLEVLFDLNKLAIDGFAFVHPRPPIARYYTGVGQALQKEKPVFAAREPYALTPHDGFV